MADDVRKPVDQLIIDSSEHGEQAGNNDRMEASFLRR
jgi:hypothetical protein